MNSFSIRQKFLDFFEKRGHKIVPSSSLIPTDPSVLFTTAGMQQFKPYFLGQNSPYGGKIASCQKCLRTSDIESVGDSIHLTFFEMLGNFSFGAYFKKETIELAIEFLTQDCQLPIEKLWFTYFLGDSQIPEDNQSRQILLKAGILKEKITGFGREDNFWGPTGDEGPCGGTVEIHFDPTNKPCQLGKKCLPNCSCGRFIELWNLVFNEYYQDKDKKLSPLEQKGIDTGLGLERLATACHGRSRSDVACQNKKTVFETDLFEPLIEIIEKNSQTKYFQSPKKMRVIADHMKAVVFLAAEGILPEKIGRGYIIKRLLRRAIREQRIIQSNKNLLIEVAQKIIDIYRDIYPEVASKEADILTVIQKEEENFSRTLDKGMKQLNKLLARIREKEIIKGEEAFGIFETYGFPLELIQEISQEKGFEVDTEGFQKALDKHQKVSRAGMDKKFGGLGIEKIKNQRSKIKIIELHTTTHLLHSALRQILGEGVKQMGSDITEERLRFDFSFGRKLSDEEIKRVEDLVNEKIKENLLVAKEEMPLKEALESGALSFFKEKYPEKVSVYSVIGFSKEICAGPHVERTGILGGFKIVKEESVGAGARRIKAILKPEQ